ncbi:Protein of unknown function DUF3128 [Trinorchestia longiramus]|nr:Protein of unknown function DUF3128 [Trinorchestia longiramus]
MVSPVVDWIPHYGESWCVLATSMVRPCEEYKDEYRECRRWRSRFHQYFIAGQGVDCTGYIQQHRHCQLYTQSGDTEALKSLVNIEVARIRTRLQGHYSNPVWGSRTEPPAGWSAPLPPVLHQRALDSSFTATDVAASDTLAACGGDDTPTHVADTPTRVAETPAADRSKSHLANLVSF